MDQPTSIKKLSANTGRTKVLAAIQENEKFMPALSQLNIEGSVESLIDAYNESAVAFNERQEAKDAPVPDVEEVEADAAQALKDAETEAEQAASADEENEKKVAADEKKTAKLAEKDPSELPFQMSTKSTDPDAPFSVGSR